MQQCFLIKFILNVGRFISQIHRTLTCNSNKDTIRGADTRDPNIVKLAIRGNSMDDYSSYNETPPRLGENIKASVSIGLQTSVKIGTGT